jgi:hypothetical protein
LSSLQGNSDLPRLRSARSFGVEGDALEMLFHSGRFPARTGHRSTAVQAAGIQSVKVHIDFVD